MTDFKTSDRDVNRAIRSWLREDRHEDVSRVAGAVLDQVDTIPQRRTTWWPARRTPTMNKMLTIALGAAAVVVVALIGFQLIGSPDPSGTGAGTTSSPEPSVAEPTATPEPSAEGGLPEGPFMLLAHDPENNFPSLTVTIPAPGWSTGDEGDPEGGGILLKNWDTPEGAAMIIFGQQEYYVFGDPCNWETTMPDTPVTTVDEFVAALASQPSRDASEPVDITLGRYTGKSITLHIPDDLDPSQCDQGTFASWNCGDAADPIPCGFHGGPGETSTEYILDVDGIIMAWHTGYQDGAPADVVAELEAIVLSASFGE